MSDPTEMRDKDNKPLWTPSVDKGAPDTIFGFPVVVKKELTEDTKAIPSARHLIFGPPELFGLFFIVESEVEE